MKSTNTQTSPDRRVRAARLARLCLLVLLGGLAYAALCTALGRGLPCPFYTVTGLQCPGCGVTRMCLSLLRLDLRAAWRYNAGLLSLSPALLAAAALLARRYLQTGSRQPGKTAGVLLWACIVWLLAWGVVRNLM